VVTTIMSYTDRKTLNCTAFNLLPLYDTRQMIKFRGEELTANGRQ
jgi:hypothetical protein